MHVTDCMKHAKRTPRGVWHVGDMSPHEHFLISDFLRSLLVPLFGAVLG